jgi:hypothetical protein
VTNYVDPESAVAQFKHIYKTIKPHLPRCAPIRLGALPKAKPSEQMDALKWICAIQRGPLEELLKVVKCMPESRWDLLKIIAPDLEEIILRKQLEKTLRIVWVETMPSILKGSKHVQDNQ